MKDKDGAISGRQFNNRLVQREPIKYREARLNVSSFDCWFRQFAVFAGVVPGGRAAGRTGGGPGAGAVEHRVLPVAADQLCTYL